MIYMEKKESGLKKRVVDNWKSTVIGIILGIVATATLLGGSCSLPEYAAFAPFWIGMMWVKDSVFKVNG